MKDRQRQVYINASNNSIEDIDRSIYPWADVTQHSINNSPRHRFLKDLARIHEASTNLLFIGVNLKKHHATRRTQAFADMQKVTQIHNMRSKFAYLDTLLTHKKMMIVD